MNSDIVIAKLLGYWQDLHAAVLRVSDHKWTPISVALALIVLITLVASVLLPVGLAALWWGIPAFISVASISWAVFWPMNCATWFGWIGMLFRLVGALALSNLSWAISAVFQ